MPGMQHGDHGVGEMPGMEHSEHGMGATPGMEHGQHGVPAMPGMGMAEMKTPVKLNDKGNGIYEGRGDLGSGGTWQVTITANQNGRLLLTKQMTLSATGGMWT